MLVRLVQVVGLADDIRGAGSAGASCCIGTVCASLVTGQLVTAGALGQLLLVGI
jgi:hypothetical protein